MDGLKAECIRGQSKTNAHQRQVDPPNIPPASILREKRSQNRPEDRTGSKWDGQKADPKGPLFQGGDVADQYLVENVQAAAPKALDETPRNDHRHRMGGGEDDGADEEDEESSIEQGFPADYVGGGDVQGLCDDDGEQEGQIGPESIKASTMQLSRDYLPLPLANRGVMM